MAKLSGEKTLELATWLERWFTVRLRQDVFASYHAPAGGKGRGSYRPVKDRRIGRGDLMGHLGAAPLGCYLMDPATDGTVRAAVVDIDDKEKRFTWEGLCEKARKAADLLEGHLLLPWACRSGSGHGVHLWLLWSEPESAAGVRAKIMAIVKEAALDVHVDIFPAQDRLNGGLGNLVALPLGRASRPLDLMAGSVVEELGDWSTIDPALSAPLSRQTVHQVAENWEVAENQRDLDAFGPADPVLVCEAMDKIPADDYGVWMRLGIVLKGAEQQGLLPAGDGRALWDRWSMKDAKFNDRAQEYNWGRFRPRPGGVGLGTLWWLAQEHGWRPPKREVITLPRAEIGATIEIIGPAIVQQNTREEIKLDEERYDPRSVKELNTRYFFTIDGGRACVFREEWDETMKRHALTRMYPHDFRVFYSNRSVQVGTDRRGLPVIKELGEVWLKSEDRRQYTELVMQPEGAEPSKYNLWRGWTIKPSDKGSWERFKGHIRENVCEGREDITDYVLNWCALLFQHPESPVGTAIVLRGGRGTGKSTFARVLGRLLGQHFMHVTHSRSITGNFNLHLRDCVLLFADEAVWAGSKSERAALNALITEPTLLIEGKGANAISCRNHVHLIIATNSEWSVPAGMDERRFLALHVGEGKKQDTGFFRDLLRELDQGGYSAMLHELLNRDIKSFNPFNMPMSTELSKQKINSLEAWASWWYEKLQEGIVLDSNLNWQDELNVQEMYADYCNYCQSSRQQPLGSPSQLLSVLESVTPEKLIRERRRKKKKELYREFQDGHLGVGIYKTTVCLPSLAECRETFDRITKFQTAWPVLKIEGDEPQFDLQNDDLLL